MSEILYNEFGEREMSMDEKNLDHFRRKVDLSIQRAKVPTHHTGAVICDKDGSHFWNEDNEYGYEEKVNIITGEKCQTCEGRGWIMDHSDKCYVMGHCDGVGCPIQRQCEECGGSGEI